MTSLRINGQDHDLDVPDDMPLLWVLRDAIANHVLKRMNDLGRPKSVRVS